MWSVKNALNYVIYLELALAQIHFSAGTFRRGKKLFSIN